MNDGDCPSCGYTETCFISTPHTGHRCGNCEDWVPFTRTVEIVYPLAQPDPVAIVEDLPDE